MRYEILKGSTKVNTIVSNEAFVAAYCKKHGYTYEALPEPEPVEPIHEPTQLDRIEAQVTYTAMMTDTLLEV